MKRNESRRTGQCHEYCRLWNSDQPRRGSSASGKGKGKGSVV